MAEIKYALRDEKINIFAMTIGGIGNTYNFQILLCKRNFLSIDLSMPVVLDMKISDSIFKKSEFGKSYYNKIQNSSYELKYIAFIDSHIKFKVNKDLFKVLNDKGFFNIWHPDAPYNYYDNKNEGYLVLFRVYIINDIVPDWLLEKGRKGRNSYFKLTEEYNAEIVEPVIDDNLFYKMKIDLINTIRENGDFIEFYNNPYTIEINKVIEKNKIDEAYTYVENSSKTLTMKELEEKIKLKGSSKRKIKVISEQYYRDPEVSIFAKKRANGICECCNEKAPFFKDDTTPYLETHHLVPLSDGGTDDIKNVCAVCPNCHRMLHFGKDRKTVTEEIINKITNYK